MLKFLKIEDNWREYAGPQNQENCSGFFFLPYLPSQMDRIQFPLVMSYALTVHKSQGLSLNCVVADLGEDVFAAGMAYVVLSRVRKLDGLYLLKFEPSSIWAERRAVEEYNRLRRKYEPSLPLLDVPETKKQIT